MRRRRSSHTSSSSSSRRDSFRLHAPNRTLWMLALLLFLVGLAGTVFDVGVTVDSSVAIWALIGSAGLLLVSTAANTG